MVMNDFVEHYFIKFQTSSFQRSQFQMHQSLIIWRTWMSDSEFEIKHFSELLLHTFHLIDGIRVTWIPYSRTISKPIPDQRRVKNLHAGLIREISTTPKYKSEHSVCFPGHVNHMINKRQFIVHNYTQVLFGCDPFLQFILDGITKYYFITAMCGRHHCAFAKSSWSNSQS